MLASPAFLWVMQHVPSLAMELRPRHHSWRGPDMISCIANCTDGLLMAMYKAVPAAFLNNSARPLGNSSIALRMFLPVALESGVIDPRDSEVRPMSVMKSLTCCGFPLHVKLPGVQTMMRPR